MVVCGIKSSKYLEECHETKSLFSVLIVVSPDIFNFSSFKNPDRIFQEMEKNRFLYSRPYENCTESLKKIVN